MTGRDLIIYILENHLEDEPVFKDGMFIGFMSEQEAAAKFDVGPKTVDIWLKMNLLDGFKVPEPRIYIPKNAEFILDKPHCR